MGPNWHPLMRVCDKKASSAWFFVSGCVFFIIFAAGKTRFCLLHLITTTMRIIKFLSVWIVWMMALPSGAQTILHRVSANVSLHPDYIVVTEVRDITPGGCDEAFVPIEDKHMTKKFIMNVIATPIRPQMSSRQTTYTGSAHSFLRMRRARTSPTVASSANLTKPMI